MTLIELMVVAAIVVLLISIGAVGISAIRGADVDATGSVLSGAMTYLTSRAVHDNRTYRLIIDMDQRRFWTESTNDDDPCSRYIPEDAELGLPEEGDEDKGDEDPEAGAEGDAPDARGGFVGVSKDRLMNRSFEPDTNVTQILTSHQTQPQSGGRAAIYFYPNGQAERALLWIGGRDSDSETGWQAEITVELHSLGQVTYHSKPVDQRDFDLLAPEEVD